MAKLRQSRLRESLGLLEHIWLNVVCQIEHCSFSEPSLQLQMSAGYSHPGAGTTQTTLTWPRDHPCPAPFIDYWLAITRLFPSGRLTWLVKALEKRKCSLYYYPHHAPFCNSLTFNKLHYTHGFCPDAFTWDKELGNLLIKNCSPANNKISLGRIRAIDYYNILSKTLKWVLGIA
jgi:hypothetical protein